MYGTTDTKKTRTYLRNRRFADERAGLFAARTWMPEADVDIENRVEAAFNDEEAGRGGIWSGRGLGGKEGEENEKGEQ